MLFDASPRALICYRIAMSHGKQLILEVAEGDDPSEAIVAFIDSIRDFAGKAGLDQGLGQRLCVVMEELVSNIVRHGRSDDAVRVAIALRQSAAGLAVTIEDNTAPFDPTQPRDFEGPDPESGGGVGLELVRHLASDHTYIREKDKNRVTFMLR